MKQYRARNTSRSRGDGPVWKGRLSKDFFAGLLYIAFGASAVAIGRSYPLGSTAHMGPGYFPMLVGTLLVLIGIVVAARGVRVRAEPVQRMAIAPLALVLGAVLLFAVAIEKLGLVLALLAVVVIGYLANPRRRISELIVLAAILIASSVLVFFYGLKLPFKLWPGAA
jgi:hypothetical protein